MKTPKNIVENSKQEQLRNLNKTLKSYPVEQGGIFFPEDHEEQFGFMFVAEMPSMNERCENPENKNFNFGVTAKDNFFKEIMIKHEVAGSYVTDIVKERNIPRRPTKEEIKKWLPFLLQEIEIIKPKAIIVIGEITYNKSFKPFVEPLIPKDIFVEWVFHYSQRGAKTNIEVDQKFGEVINRVRDIYKIN
jgi:uracil-DNA glycosylase family 4